MQLLSLLLLIIFSGFPGFFPSLSFFLGVSFTFENFCAELAQKKKKYFIIQSRAITNKSSSPNFKTYFKIPFGDFIAIGSGVNGV